MTPDWKVSHVVFYGEGHFHQISAAEVMKRKNVNEHPHCSKRSKTIVLKGQGLEPRGPEL